MKKSIKGFGALLAATTLLAAASPAYAAKVDGQDNKTTSQLEIIDQGDPDKGTVELQKVPEVFEFSTNLQANGVYEIDGEIPENGLNYVVFSDSTKKEWAVRSTVEKTMTFEAAEGKTKTVDVTGLDLTVDGKEKPAKSGEIVMSSTENPVGAAGTEHKVTDGEKNTDATVKITEKTVDPDDPDAAHANLKFIEAPGAFHFETILTDDAYTLEADTKKTYGDEKAIADGAKYKVFSDATGAQYKIKSVIDGNKLTSGKKTVDITSFKINDQDLVGKNAGATKDDVVMDQENNKFEKSGYAEMAVDKIAISFTAAEGTVIEPGDQYEGTITNTLYNIYTEAKAE